MTSPRSTSAGASERDSRKRVGSSGWRTLTWPYASTTPSFARIRLAITTSRTARSSSVTVVPPLPAASAEVAIRRGVGHPQPEPLDQRRHLGHVLGARRLVRAALEPPVLVTGRAPRIRAPEHVEPARIPAIDRRLGLAPALLGSHHVAELDVAVAHVRLLLLKDPRQRAVERQIGTADELFELVLAHAVDEKTERGNVRPRRHGLPERLEIAPGLLDVHELGGVLTELVEEPVDLAEVVDLLAGHLGQHPLIVRRRRRQQPLGHVEMRAADLAIGLDAQHALEQRLVLRGHLRDVVRLDLVAERFILAHQGPLAQRVTLRMIISTYRSAIASGASRPPSENHVATPVHIVRMAMAVSLTSAAWKTPARAPEARRPRNTRSYSSRRVNTRRRLACVSERSSLWLRNASCWLSVWKSTWKRTAARSRASGPSADATARPTPARRSSSVRSRIAKRISCLDRKW